MKKDKSTEMDDKYWEGISSLNEDRNLKDQAKEGYFNELKELSNEEMKWDFADFMNEVENDNDQQRRKAAKVISIKPFAYTSAVAALVIAGFFFLRHVDSPSGSFQSPQFSRIDLHPRKVEVDESDQIEVPHYVEITPERKKTVRKATATTSLGSLQTDLAVESPEEAYVIVNGQPVYNQEEAEQVVLASLKIMASNFQEGKHALEKVKYINVEL